MDNDYYIDTTYRRPASKGTASLNQSGGFVNCGPWSCFVPQHLKMFNVPWTPTFASTRRIDVRRARAGHQLNGRESSPPLIASVLPSPSVLQDIECTFSDNGFCLAAMYQCSASGDCQTGASKYGTRKTCWQDIDVW
ncbi:hypothetical protein IW261DRAFT_1565027 [Armillaria novae-zelandiae]|uniref:Uncharacterized protein n=1 Tax=Armillaria novae-zelandiae TaxID=153914 RepID=A0AA39P802_9AGAR|nr:hypothetical protein IW261DRAFT_1565027 [Armillaria novae-zelandiae]